MAKYDFAGKQVIVTGGTRGIGAEISRAFLDAGARVTATFARNNQAAEDFKVERMDDGERLEIVQLDSSDYEAAEKFFKVYLDGEKSLDILVNNGGIRRDSVMAAMSLENWESVIAVNLTGAFIMSKFAVLAMGRPERGRIINITSPSGRIGLFGQANYAASKSGMAAMTKSLSREIARRKITVNCVSPGFIATDLLADIPEEKLKEFKAMIPMKRFGKPADAAAAVLFLADPAADYITGAVLEVTGGL